WRGGKYFFAIEQYTAWMRELAAQFASAGVSFLVCSDETRNPAEFPGLTVGCGTDSPVGDLYALARCDYILGPPSTFSQWASFYGNKPLLQVKEAGAQVERQKFAVSYLGEIPR